MAKKKENNVDVVENDAPHKVRYIDHDGKAIEASFISKAHSELLTHRLKSNHTPFQYVDESAEASEEQ